MIHKGHFNPASTSLFPIHPPTYPRFLIPTPILTQNRLRLEPSLPLCQSSLAEHIWMSRDDVENHWNGHRFRASVGQNPRTFCHVTRKDVVSRYEQCLSLNHWLCDTYISMNHSHINLTATNGYATVHTCHVSTIRGTMLIAVRDIRVLYTNLQNCQSWKVWK